MGDDGMTAWKKIVIILSILAIIVPVTVAFGSYSEKINSIEDRLNDPTQTEKINNLDTRVIELEKTTVRTETLLISIQNDIGEIKTSMKNIHDSIINN